MATRTVAVADHPDLIPPQEVARLLGVTEKSLERMAREGRGPKRGKIGNRAYYRRPDVDAWIERLFAE